MGDRAHWMGGLEAGQAAGPGPRRSFSPWVRDRPPQSSPHPHPPTEFIHVWSSPHCVLLRAVPFPNSKGLYVFVTELINSPSEAWPSAPLSVDLAEEKRTNMSSGTQASNLGILLRSINTIDGKE